MCKLHWNEDNINKYLAFYVVPLILTIMYFIPFFNFSGVDLYSSLTGVYILYITITTIILSIIFVVISVAPTFIQNERNGPFKPIIGNYPINSIYLIYVNLRVLQYCVMGIIFSLMGYIFTTVHFLPDVLLKGLFLVNTFFVIAAIMGLALLTGRLIKNLGPQLIQ